MYKKEEKEIKNKKNLPLFDFYFLFLFFFFWYYFHIFSHIFKYYLLFDVFNYLIKPGD